jgi:hypothetical protein
MDTNQKDNLQPVEEKTIPAASKGKQKQERLARALKQNLLRRKKTAEPQLPELGKPDV